MYILVGALALAIGCIYMVLEARESKAAKAVNISVEGNTENKGLYEENKID